MSDEIRTEDFETTELVETEDVKEGLGLAEYAVVGGIAGAAIVAWELGKLGWKKTEKPRAKVKDFVKGIFTKNKDSKKTEDVPEHEGSTETAAEETEGKTTENKKNSKKK